MGEGQCIRRAGFGLVVALGVACVEPEEPTPAPRTCLDFDEVISDVPDFPVTYETEHLDIHVEPERFLCAGSAIDYERHVQYVADQLGIEIQRRMPVYAMTWANEYCSGHAACAKRDGVVFANSFSAYHELTHGVACEIGSDTPAILAEGLAVSFAPEDNEWIDVPEEFAEIHTSEFSYYYSYAGHFVRWLAEQLGPEAFAALYRTASYHEGVWSAMESAYGGDLAMDYASESPAMWIPHRQCADMPVLEAGADGGWVFEARFDCDAESTLGPYEKTDRIEVDYMYQSFLVDVPEPATYRVEASDSGPLSIQYERCLNEHPATEQAIEDERVTGSVFFALFDDYGFMKFEHPGWWRVDVLYPHGPPVDVWVTIMPEP